MIIDHLLAGMILQLVVMFYEILVGSKWDPYSGKKPAS